MGLKKLIPEFIASKIRKRRSDFYGKSTTEAFTKIFKEGYWRFDNKGSFSGPGSSIEITKEVQKGLTDFLVLHSIKSIADIGCGDFGWMSKVLPEDIHYFGYDIVNELIEDNRVRYSGVHIDFKQLNIIDDKIPSVDLVLCRDCFVHLDFKSIQKSLANILASGPTWVGITSFPDCTNNIDITSGNWRPLNLERPPFSLPVPTIALKDMNTEKVLNIWHYNQLMGK